MSDIDDQAGQYLLAGNAVAGFYVAQTILFMNGIYESPVLLSALVENKCKATVTTVVIAMVYAATIGLCGYTERRLRSISYNGNDNQKVVLNICILATLWRIAVVFILCVGCVLAIDDLKKPSEAQVKAACN